MNIKAMYISYLSLCVYDFGDDEIMTSLGDLLHGCDDGKIVKKWAKFFKTLCRYGCTNDLTGYISRLVLSNNNCFTRASAAGDISSLDENVLDAVKNDLKILEKLSSITPDDIIASLHNDDDLEAVTSMARWSSGKSDAVLGTNWSEKTSALQEYHSRNGYGEYAKYRVFTWRDSKINPVTSANPITITDLKSYEKQRQRVVDNTESFVMGLPANNVLLYGDRGTGKSSTVHAVLNMFTHRGLRMIEVSKGDIPQFPVLLEKLMKSPMKFIIFIDDLSFNSDDDSYAQLKAVLEGSVSAKQSNTLIYATSNRRHLIKESFAERQGDELHRTDTIQETLSLSDRFGLSITFVNPDKARFFEIMDKIILDRKIDVDLDKLHCGAERWALERGGRSPRIAKQYIDLVESKVKRGLEW